MESSPFHSDANPMFKMDPSQQQQMPQQPRGSFEQAGYQAPLLRADDQQPQHPQQQPQPYNSDTHASPYVQQNPYIQQTPHEQGNLQGNLHGNLQGNPHFHPNENPAMCNICGKSKINGQHHHHDHQQINEVPKSTNDTWKIVVGVVVGIVGLIIIAGVISVMSSSSSSVKSPISPGQIPIQITSAPPQPNVIVETIRNASIKPVN